MRYIPVGGDEQLESFAVSIKFVTVVKNAIPNAARNIPPPLPPSVKKNDTEDNLLLID